MKRILSVTVLMLISGFALAKASFDGAWQAASGSSGQPKATLIFKEDGTYQWDETGDGKPEMWGIYKLNPDLQVAFSEKGTTRAGGVFQGGGLYIYEVDGPAMRLMPDTDNHEIRKAAFKVNWVRKP